ncbi:MAG: hypothetical protein ACI87W_001166, partial [Halieaceae bacterium]
TYRMDWHYHSCSLLNFRFRGVRADASTQTTGANHHEQDEIHQDSQSRRK